MTVSTLNGRKHVQWKKSNKVLRELCLGSAEKGVWTQRILTFHTETIANINNVLGYICCLACSTQYTQSRLRFDELCSGNKNIQIQKYME